MRALFGCLLLLAALALAVAVQAAPVPLNVPLAAQASPHFNPETATQAWLATVNGPARSRSDAYFEGSNWLILWDFLYSSAILLLLLETKISARLRTLATRISRRFWLQAFLYWIAFATLFSLLLLTLNIYEGFFREHQYGLSNQTFLSWSRDAFIGFLLLLFLAGPLVATLYAFVRRFPASWHIWGTVVVVLFTILGAAIAPVFLMPLFNRYTPLPDSRIKAQILSLAHANGIPVDNVYESNASRQSKRVSANVSGLLGTDRITLNDNLLARCSEQGVIAVMGHEMGHYVMHHVWNGVLFSSLLTLLVFALLKWLLARLLASYGSRWRARDTSDVAALPLAILLLSAIFFILTPVENTYARTQEFEADIFGLNAARQPDGEAQVDLLLGEYRKLNPTPLEEFLFFDHPSGRRRIQAAMQWKAENLCLFDASLSCENRPETLLAIPTRPSPRSAALPQ